MVDIQTISSYVQNNVSIGTGKIISTLSGLGAEVGVVQAKVIYFLLFMVVFYVSISAIDIAKKTINTSNYSIICVSWHKCWS